MQNSAVGVLAHRHVQHSTEKHSRLDALRLCAQSRSGWWPLCRSYSYRL